MINNIGIDIVEIERFKNAIKKHPGMIKRLFTETEISYCQGRPKPYLHFAVRFAAKEAILKTFETGRSGVGWKDVEVTKTESGSPKVNLYNNAITVCEKKNIDKVLISLSFSHTNAIASAVALRG